MKEKMDPENEGRIVAGEPSFLVTLLVWWDAEGDGQFAAPFASRGLLKLFKLLR